MKLAQDIKAARRVYIAGNGGSAANAIHLANDLISVGIKAHALTADVATITAIANDFSYEEIFSRQLEVFGEAGDLLIVFSGSGNSPNILKALEVAHRKGIYSYAILGSFGGGGLAAQTADTVMIQGSDMQDAENLQLRIGHDVLRALRPPKQVTVMGTSTFMPEAA